MHEYIDDDSFMCATDYMHESSLHLDEDHVGQHGPECHSRPMMCCSKSGPSQRAITSKSYLSCGGATENGKSCMSSHAFLSSLHLLALPLPPPLQRADRDVCMATRLASDVALNIMNAPVVGSPLMNELRRLGKERCFDHSAPLGYSTYDSDNDSNHSVKRKTADRKVSWRMLCLVVL
jgi:hypothetical protein